MLMLLSHFLFTSRYEFTFTVHGLVYGFMYVYYSINVPFKFKAANILFDHVMTGYVLPPHYRYLGNIINWYVDI